MVEVTLHADKSLVYNQ